MIIDGKEVGVINLDIQGQTSADLDLSVDKAGIHTYRLVSQTMFVDDAGGIWQVDGSGRGTIHIESGAAFNLWGDYSGQRASVELSPA